MAYALAAWSSSSGRTGVTVPRPLRGAATGGGRFRKCTGMHGFGRKSRQVLVVASASHCERTDAQKQSQDEKQNHKRSQIGAERSCSLPAFSYLCFCASVRPVFLLRAKRSQSKPSRIDEKPPPQAANTDRKRAAQCAGDETKPTRRRARSGGCNYRMQCPRREPAKGVSRPGLAGRGTGRGCFRSSTVRRPRGRPRPGARAR